MLALQTEVDLFGDDEVDEEAERIKAERVAAYNAKKEKKAATGNVIIAKSSILLDVKVCLGEPFLHRVVLCRSGFSYV